MGGKKKKRESGSSALRSSSLRRDSVSATKTSTTHHVSVGCMSGIFHFVSKYHNRRKFLTFGNKKQDREATVQPPRNPGNATCHTHDQRSPSARVISLEVPRSPAIPAEIRRSVPSLNPSNSPMAAVARLMGIREIPATTEVAAAEKRRKLLGALEKCDEDLEALKSIIMAVRAVQTPPSTPPRGGVGKDEEEGEEDEMGSEEPSPVSVLDHRPLVSRSPNMSYSKRTTRQDKILQQCHQQMDQQQQEWQRRGRKRPGEEDHQNAMFCFENKPYSSSLAITKSLFAPVKTREWLNIVAGTRPTGSPWSSAMRDNVIEVCKDVEFGQRREVSGVVLILQDIIIRELIDDIIKEMDCFHVSWANNARSLPYEACMRKLSF